MSVAGSAETIDLTGLQEAVVHSVERERVEVASYHIPARRSFFRELIADALGGDPVDGVIIIGPAVYAEDNIASRFAFLAPLAVDLGFHREER